MPGYAAPPAYYQPPPRKRRVWLIVLLAVGTPVAVIVLLFVAGIGMYLLSSETPASEAEQALVLRYADLEPYFEGLPARPQRVAAVKRDIPGAGYEIEYEYEHEDLFIYSLFAMDRSINEARMSFTAIQVGTGYGMRSEGVTQEPADHLLRWGDQSACYILRMNGQPIGNRFVARKGRKIVNFLFSGAYFDSAEEFRGMIMPVLDRVEAR
jgi:hypothetical protein